MIIKKPYAFLIKHFKLIHLLLSTFILYLVYMTHQVVIFFNDYAKNGYYAYSNNLNTRYINFYMFIAIIFIIVLASFIYLLMRWKKKSRLFYISLCLFYLGLFVGLLVYFGIFQNLVNTTLDIRVVRAYRDVIVILYLPQYFFLIYSIIRAIGFDIKKFDFKKDLEELDIAEEDQEEIEVTFGQNSYKYKRKARRTYRELKYYVLENKFFFSIIGGTLAVVIIFLIYINAEVFNKTYNESDYLLIDGVRFKVLNSYISDVDLSGNSIYKDKKYVIVKVLMENTLSKRKNVDTNGLKLIIGNNTYYPIYSLIDYFKDLGEGFYKNTLYAGLSYEYLFVYEIPSNIKVSDAYFSIFDSVDIVRGEISSNNKNIKLKLVDYMDLDEKSEYSMNESISLNDSTLSNSKFMVNSYEIGDKFIENYTYCVSECYTGKKIITPDSLGKNDRTILRLNLYIDINNNLYIKKYLTSVSEFMETFGSISYVINDEEKHASIVIKNLDNIDTLNTYIEVPYEIKNASSIKLKINIRNKEYVVGLS